MNSILIRLRENRYNNLEDLILEAADSCPDNDSAQVFRLLAGRLPKIETEIKQDVMDSIEDDSEEQYDTGWNNALDEVCELDILTGEDDILEKIETLYKA